MLEVLNPELVKLMAKKAAEAAPTAEAPAASSTTALPSQVEMTRQAIEAGHDKPKAGVAWIKETFGFDMTTSGFSTNKNGLKKKAGASGEVAVARKPRSEVATSPRKSGTVEVTNPEEQTMALMAALFPLVEQYGRHRVLKAAQFLSENGG